MLLRARSTPIRVALWRRRQAKRRATFLLYSYGVLVRSKRNHNGYVNAKEALSLGGGGGPDFRCAPTYPQLIFIKMHGSAFYLDCCGPSPPFFLFLQTLIPKLEMRLQGVGASEEQYHEQMEALQVFFLRLCFICCCCCVVAVACYKHDLALDFFFQIFDSMEF